MTAKSAEKLKKKILDYLIIRDASQDEKEELKLISKENVDKMVENV